MRIILALGFILITGLSKAETSQFSTAAVDALAERVADWQLAHLDDLSYLRSFQQQSADTKGWVQAAFYIGLTRWVQSTPGSRYEAALQKVVEINQGRIGELFWHADDQAIAQVYLALPQARIGAAEVQALREHFERIMASRPTLPSLEFIATPEGISESSCQWRWCWCDALFMAPPAWAALSRLSADERYLDYALAEYQATRDFLYDAEEHLFYRDSRFFERRSAHGNKVFWSRGNGWVFAGLPLLLEQMPAAHPARASLLQTYREMAAKLLRLQGEKGFWASSLLEAPHHPLPETSGTAFIAFGFAWGIKRGLLEKQQYLPALNKAWSALEASVDKNGKLQWVQPIGYAPDEVRIDDTQFYGVGALLLAASEMRDLSSQK